MRNSALFSAGEGLVFHCVYRPMYNCALLEISDAFLKLKNACVIVAAVSFSDNFKYCFGNCCYNSHM